MQSRFQESVANDGFAIVKDAIDDAEVNALRSALQCVVDRTSVRSRGSTFAIRNLIDLVPQVRQLAGSHQIRRLATSVLGPACFPVRAILFDKVPSANWLVPWHQDLTIAVRLRRDVANFGPWSEKAGVPHVQPPVEILERMLSIRVHLDDCLEGNGPLRVLPGSHRVGRLSHDEIALWQVRSRPVSCDIETGGILVMRPLLLHASSEAQSPGHRRVIHLDFAAEQLPEGLAWHNSAESTDAPPSRIK